MYALLASAALLASTALAGSPGSAIVINGCNYDVKLSSVPAQYGGYEETDHTLSPGQSYSQQWTSLSNGAGWSIKLAKQAGASSIMQYEYTYQNDGTIWYDLSCVDGNPWDANWQVSASGDSSCKPKDSFYRYATDDAFGMQSCNSDASVTVTLCSGESQNDKLVSAVASAVGAAATAIESIAAAAVAPKTIATSTTTPAPAPVVAPTTHTTEAPAAPSTTHTEPTTSHTEPAATQGNRLGYNGANFYNANIKANAVAPTTLATSATKEGPVAIAAATDAEGDWVTIFETVVETAVAYETYAPGKRHVHHPDHPHFR